MKKRWLNPLPGRAVYHVVSRVVDKRFVLHEAEKDWFRELLHRYERFSGCRVLGYCVMTNHFHLLLEVPPSLEEPELTDEELLWRLGGLYGKAEVQEVADQLERASALIEGCFERAERLSVAHLEKRREQGERMREEIHARFSYRMHSLSEFMKGLLQRFTRWFNRRHEREGVLWERRFRSVMVEDGLACRVVAAYIDLNPVRGGICEDPAHYRWSSYGEAVGSRGEVAKRARAGLIRALHGDRSGIGKEEEVDETALPEWSGRRTQEKNEKASAGVGRTGPVSREYRRILLAGVLKGKEREKATDSATLRKLRAEFRRLEVGDELSATMVLGRTMCHRVRYFTRGAVIGSRAFVEEVFRLSRDRLGKNRQTGARKVRDDLAEFAGEIWSLRDLR